jgi:ABC-2 type transport system ATP-binding protein
VSGPVAALSGVSQRFRAGGGIITALDGITAALQSGRITGLVGPDGAGKTTLIRLLTGLLPPDAGTVTVLGHDTRRSAAAIQARIGYMPQRFGLYEDLTVAENLTLYADLYGVPVPARRSRFDRLHAFTGLAPFTARLAGRLSGGMKQKLGLACVLVREPELLLLDEPTVGVDPLSRRELWGMVQELLAEGISVVWSTVYLDEASRCDDVLVLHEGHLLAQAPPGRFLAEVAGRVVAVRPLPGERRRLARRLEGEPEVLDVVPSGSELRCVLESPAAAERLAQTLAPRRMRPQPASLEDAVVVRLRRRNGGRRPEPEVASPSPTATRPAAASDGTAVIEVRDLVRRFGDFLAVGGVSFKVRHGEIFGLLGPNGAGKSTTFKMLCGLLPPTGGTARVLGIDLGRAAAHARARLGYMPQRFAQYGDLSVRQNLEFTASAYDLNGARRRGRIAWALEGFALAPHAEQDAKDLPLGVKQRLALASALLHEPGILFLDEPTSGVDPLARRTFWSRINALAENGVTVLVTTHFLEEAEYCDRVGIIDRGRLIVLDTPAGVRAGAATVERPEPTLEDAFIRLVRQEAVRAA